MSAISSRLVVLGRTLRMLLAVVPRPLCVLYNIATYHFYNSGAILYCHDSCFATTTESTEQFATHRFGNHGSGLLIRWLETAGAGGRQAAGEALGAASQGKRMECDAGEGSVQFEALLVGTGEGTSCAVHGSRFPPGVLSVGSLPGGGGPSYTQSSAPSPPLMQDKHG